MNRKMLIAVFALLSLAVFFAGCSDDDHDDNSAGPGDDDTTEDDDGAGDDDDNDTGQDDDDDTDDDDDSADDDDEDDPDIAILDSPQNPYPDGFDFNETLPAGPLRLKAVEYDAWHEQWHQPYYGASVGAFFVDEERTAVDHYYDTKDSCLWSGAYLASQAFRYAVTGDPQAKANAIRTAQALSGNLHVTGRPGFIARYRGPQLSLADDCDQLNEEMECHYVDEGEFAGDFWKDNTSRDQYSGWFFGMAVAYDLVDDEPMRNMIRADVTEVLTELITENWWIIDIDGRPTTAAPKVMATMQIPWSLIGYHMTGQEAFREVVQHWLADENRQKYEISLFNFFNRYAQYYSNSFGHKNFYSLLRLARVYVNDGDYQYYKNVFDTKQHTFTRLSHNAFFTNIHMSQGIYDPGKANDPYLDQITQDLTDFMSAPKFRYASSPPAAPLDPVSVFLAALWIQFPILEEMMGGIEEQALEAYPVNYQCTVEFQWRRNPFKNYCYYVEELREVNPGIDYLVAYWMAAFHGYVQKDQ